MRYMLDTNAWVNYLRGKSPAIAARLAAKSHDEILFCAVVLGELLHGARRSAKPEQNLKAVQALSAPFVCLPFDAAAAARFAEIRQSLDLAGTPIGPYDLLIAAIAAIALEQGCAVVTHNVAEFSRVPGLLVEDWEAG